jgi:hypothetical protein
LALSLDRFNVLGNSLSLALPDFDTFGMGFLFPDRLISVAALHRLPARRGCNHLTVGHPDDMGVVVIGQMGRDLALRTERLPDVGGTEPIVEHVERHVD